MSPTALRYVDSVEIMDIHQDNMEFSLVDDIYKSLDPPSGKQRTFPTLLLYDAKGLKLFEKITFLEEYYPTNTEIEVLETHAKRIVERIPENAQLVELGSGYVTLMPRSPTTYNIIYFLLQLHYCLAESDVHDRNLRKIEILLRECERTEKKVDYYALDLSLVELQRTFSEISPEGFQYVGFHGLHGTYDDAMSWLKRPENRKRPMIVMSMGSSIGNFDRASAAEFLGGFSGLLTASDFLLIGLDACKKPEKVFRAYNDSEGVTRQFYENGLVHANKVLGFDAFKGNEWEILTGYDDQEGCHKACYAPKVDVTINGITIPKGEKLVLEEAWKYGRDERDRLWRDANLILQVEFSNTSDDYRESILVLWNFADPSKRRASFIASCA